MVFGKNEKMLSLNCWRYRVVVGIRLAGLISLEGVCFARLEEWSQEARGWRK
jgi:hypothetical protein